MEANTFIVQGIGHTFNEISDKGWGFIGGWETNKIGKNEIGEAIIQLKFNVRTLKGNQILTHGPQGSILTLTGTLSQINESLHLSSYELYIDKNGNYNSRFINESTLKRYLN